MYTEVVRLENVRLVKIRNLMSPSPELDLDCQLSGNRLANRSFQFPPVQAAECEQSFGVELNK